MTVTRRSLSPWWPLVWLVTSAILVAALLQVESGWFLAAFYLGLNACTVLYVYLGDRPVRARRMRIVGWCVAVQLPAMLWLFVNARRAPERLHSQRLLDDSQSRR